MEFEAAFCLNLVLLGGLSVGAIGGLFPALIGVLRRRLWDGSLSFFACVLSGLLFGALLAVPAAVLLTVAIYRRARIRWLRVFLVVGIVAVVGAGTFLIFRLFSADPVIISTETTRLTEPLDENGLVDYLTAVNERYSQNVTAETNAAVVMWQVLGPPPEVGSQNAAWFEAMGMQPLPEDGDYWQPLADIRTDVELAPPQPRREQLDQAVRTPWNEQQLPLIAEWLRVNHQRLDRFAEGTRRPHYFTPKIADTEFPLLIAAPSLESDAFRELTNALRARAMFRAKRGEIEGAWDDLRACRRFGDLLGQGPTIVDAAIRAVVIRSAATSLMGLAEHGQLSRSQTQEILQDVAAEPPLHLSSRHHDLWERYCTLDGIARIAKLGPLKATSFELDQSQTFTNAVARFCYNSCVDWNELLREANCLIDQGVAARRETDPAKKRQLWDQFDQRWSQVEGLSDFHFEQTQRREFLMGCSIGACRGPDLVNRQAYYVLQILMPMLTADVLQQKNMQVDHRLAFLAVALAAHRADHGTYPETLEALTPQYIEELPADPWSGKSFCYRREESGFVLYSVDHDGQDNGGVEFDVNQRGPWDIVVRVPSERPSDE
jgi:hypothetical protein